MIYDELLAKIDELESVGWWSPIRFKYPSTSALRAVVELHRPAWASDGDMCLTCSKILNVTSFEMTVQQAKYPCSTIKAIEKELA